MARSTTSKSKKEAPWWVNDIVMPLVITTISLLPYFNGSNIDKTFESKSIQPAQSLTQNKVDSVTLNNLQNNKNVFINSGLGHQNNNTDSGQQTIINK